MKRAALLSVSNRDGLPELARALAAAGFELLATSGTLNALAEAGIKGVSLESYTGQNEILDGRVKTLHPRVHAGILARRDDPNHMAELEREGIMPIDVVVVNLYPFVDYLSTDTRNSAKKMIELVDIGGPTMIRAAAKNFPWVLPVMDPKDYPRIIEELQKSSGAEKIALDFRRELAVKVFANQASYDLAIAQYFSNVHFEGSSTEQATVEVANDFMLGPVGGFVLERAQGLRYGENPHQQAAYFRRWKSGANPWKQLHGKELSYNNLLDFDAALKLIRSFDRKTPVAAIIKHLNPCGVAYGETLADALRAAKRCDPRSHFGGVIAFNQPFTDAVAQEVAEDFAEIVLAPHFEPAALQVLQKRKNLRVIEVDLDNPQRFEVRSVDSGILIQERDSGVSAPKDARLMTTRPPSDAQWQDLNMAWTVCAHVKSNAVAIVKDGMLVAVGAGQMSRIDSTEVALSKAGQHGHDLKDAVAASDAFFPFPDSVRTLVRHGVSAIIVPSGSRADEEVVSAAEELGVSLLFVTDRHFRH